MGILVSYLLGFFFLNISSALWITFAHQLPNFGGAIGSTNCKGLFPLTSPTSAPRYVLGGCRQFFRMGVTIDAPGKSCKRCSALWVPIRFCALLSKLGHFGPAASCRDGPDPSCVLQRTQLIQNAGEAALGSSGLTCGPEPMATPFVEQSPLRAWVCLSTLLWWSKRRSSCTKTSQMTYSIADTGLRNISWVLFSHMNSSSGGASCKNKKLLSLLQGWHYTFGSVPPCHGQPRAYWPRSWWLTSIWGLRETKYGTQCTEKCPKIKSTSTHLHPSNFWWETIRWEPLSAPSQQHSLTSCSQASYLKMSIGIKWDLCFLVCYQQLQIMRFLWSSQRVRISEVTCGLQVQLMHLMESSSCWSESFAAASGKAVSRTTEQTLFQTSLLI